jgi:hypothetical protein
MTLYFKFELLVLALCRYQSLLNEQLIAVFLLNKLFLC